MPASLDFSAQVVRSDVVNNSVAFVLYTHAEFAPILPHVQQHYDTYYFRTDPHEPVPAFPSRESVLHPQRTWSTMFSAEENCATSIVNKVRWDHHGPVIDLTTAPHVANS
jgi:hypothetical protein